MLPSVIMPEFRVLFGNMHHFHCVLSDIEIELDFLFKSARAMPTESSVRKQDPDNKPERAI